MYIDRLTENKDIDFSQLHYILEHVSAEVGLFTESTTLRYAYDYGANNAHNLTKALTHYVINAYVTGYNTSRVGFSDTKTRRFNSSLRLFSPICEVFNTSTTFHELNENVGTLIGEYLRGFDTTSVLDINSGINFVLDCYPELHYLHLSYEELILRSIEITAWRYAQRYYDIACFAAKLNNREERFSEVVIELIDCLTPQEICIYSNIIKEHKNNAEPITGIS
jgi:hypothetical protein